MTHRCTGYSMTFPLPDSILMWGLFVTISGNYSACAQYLRPSGNDFFVRVAFTDDP